MFQNEAMRMRGEIEALAWPDLRRQVASFAAALRGMGVQRGDRVCAFLPNTPQTAVAFLATASLGAVWSVCSPDMGAGRGARPLPPIEPVVLIGCDGYRHGGVAHDRLPLLRQLLDALPTVRHAVLLRYVDVAADPTSIVGPARQAHDFAALVSNDAAFAPEWLPFDHPLWIVYSSGTTGLPKAIVHGHGGVMIEALKLTALHNDIGPTVETGDRFHWYSATGWIMWNCQIAGCSAARRSASTTAARRAWAARPTGRPCGASSPTRRRRSLAPARRSTRAA